MNIRSLASGIASKLGSQDAILVFATELLKHVDAQKVSMVNQILRNIAASEDTMSNPMADRVARGFMAAKGEVPEAFKKQWADKDRDNDGKENEPMPEGLKKSLEKKAKSLEAADFTREEKMEIARATDALGEIVGDWGDWGTKYMDLVERWYPPAKRIWDRLFDEMGDLQDDVGL